MCLTNPKNLKAEVSMLPTALTLFKDNALGNRIPVIFLDFDGTLVPIVDNPDDAALSTQMRTILEEVNKTFSCSILTGRDRLDIEHKIGMEGILYAGSHGYDISGKGIQWIYEEGLTCIPFLDKAEAELRSNLEGETGALIERKKFAIAVHYRNVPKDRVPNLLKVVNAVIYKHDCLKAGPGKMVLEVKPYADWHKGKALEWLMNHMKWSWEDYIPIFIGDDLTDEDAFKIVQKKGIGILVGGYREGTYASFSLKNPTEVALFLDGLCALK